MFYSQFFWLNLSHGSCYQANCLQLQLSGYRYKLRCECLLEWYQIYPIRLHHQIALYNQRLAISFYSYAILYAELLQISIFPQRGYNLQKTLISFSFIYSISQTLQWQQFSFSRCLFDYYQRSSLVSHCKGCQT